MSRLKTATADPRHVENLMATQNRIVLSGSSWQLLTELLAEKAEPTHELKAFMRRKK